MIKNISHNCFDNFTDTCKKHWWDEMGKSSSDDNNYNVFLEYWDGRKFIGALYGDGFLNDCIYVDQLFINTKYRNKGYGTYIINQLADKYKYIYVESTQEAFGFYKKCGFIKKRDQDNRIYSNTIDMHFHKKRKKKYEQ